MLQYSLLVLKLSMVVQIWQILHAGDLLHFCFKLLYLFIAHVQKYNEECFWALFDSIHVQSCVDAVIWRAVVHDFSAHIMCLKLVVSFVDEGAWDRYIQVHQRDHMLRVHHTAAVLILIDNFVEFLTNGADLLLIFVWLLHYFVEGVVNTVFGERIWDEVHYINLFIKNGLATTIVVASHANQISTV